MGTCPEHSQRLFTANLGGGFVGGGFVCYSRGGCSLPTLVGDLPKRLSNKLWAKAACLHGRATTVLQQSLLTVLATCQCRVCVQLFTANAGWWLFKPVGRGMCAQTLGRDTWRAAKHSKGLGKPFVQPSSLLPVVLSTCKHCEAVMSTLGCGLASL